jgi:hypothetical protein
MIFAIDFDGTVVHEDHAYDDLKTPLRFMPGAREALLALKAAGHTLFLWSGRASVLLDPRRSQLWKAGISKRSHEEWEKRLPLQRARYDQMVRFVNQNLPGIFDAIDDGEGGKPPADVFIDNRAFRLGHGAGGVSWYQLAHWYGSPVPVSRAT